MKLNNQSKSLEQEFLSSINKVVEIDPRKCYVIIFKGTREEMYQLANQLAELFATPSKKKHGNFIIVNSALVNDVLELKKFLSQLGFIKR